VALNLESRGGWVGILKKREEKKGSRKLLEKTDARKCEFPLKAGFQGGSLKSQEVLGEKGFGTQRKKERPRIALLPQKGAGCQLKQRDSPFKKRNILKGELLPPKWRES